MIIINFILNNKKFWGVGWYKYSNNFPKIFDFHILATLGYGRYDYLSAINTGNCSFKIEIEVTK